MKKKLVDLIAKLKEIHPYYDISTKNFMQPETEEKLVDGIEVVARTHTVVMQVTVFAFKEGAQQAIIEKKVDGVGEGSTRLEAVENATIAAINTLGIN